MGIGNCTSENRWCLRPWSPCMAAANEALYRPRYFFGGLCTSVYGQPFIQKSRTTNHVRAVYTARNTRRIVLRARRGETPRFAFYAYSRAAPPFARRRPRPHQLLHFSFNSLPIHTSINAFNYNKLRPII